MRRVILATVSTVAVLVFLLSFKTHATSVLASSPPSAVAGPAPAGSASAGTSGLTSSATPGATASASPASVAARTVTGDAAQTIYGPVQVRVTVKNGKVTAASAVEYPQQDPRDFQINSYAIPALNQEAVSASSAQIDSISGATFTSEGYVTSLQSALTKAGL
jgi:uncharacterized protein with FMN-binding domain